MNIVDATMISQTSQSEASSSSALAQQDFLQLLISQLSNQDPLSPSDSAEFVAQLAQFSSLEQMVGMNSKLDTLAMAEAASNSMNAASLLGRQVTVSCDQVQLQDEGSASLSFDFPSSSSSVEISIQDESGKVVRVIELGSCDAGLNSISWDGCDADGNRLPPGEYSFTAKGLDGDGAPVTASGYVSGVVDGVSFDKGYPEILIGDKRFTLGEILEIK